MIKNKSVLVPYKVIFGLLGFCAVVTEIVVLIDRGVFNPANFFSFFTIESNIFAACMLIVSAVMLTDRPSPKLDLLRGAATLYMIITGIVFAVLLSGIEGIVLTAVPWDNIVLHYIMPLILTIDWMFDPPKNRIRFRHAILWLIYPLFYVSYSLIRGHLVGWYPYPFLNPSLEGYDTVILTSIGIAVLALVVTRLLICVYKRPPQSSSLGK